MKNRAARILDYGCGYGRTLAELYRASYDNVIGTDFRTMLERLRQEIAD